MFVRFGGRTRGFGRAATARAAAVLLLVAPAARAAPMDEPPASALAPLEANAAGLALAVLILLLLLAAVAAASYVSGRRSWIRKVNELEAELARTTAKLDRSSMICEASRRF